MNNEMGFVSNNDEFKRLIKKHKTKGCLTNCLLPSIAVFEPFIASGKLLWREFEEGLALYPDEGRYYRLIYFLKPDCEKFPRFGRSEKPVLLEELDSDNKREAYLKRVLPMFEEAGFAFESKNYQVTYDIQNGTDELKKRFEECIEELREKGLSVTLDLNEKQAAQAIELWEKYLKVTDVPEGHYEFLKNPNQYVLGFIDSNEDVCGINFWEIINNFSDIRHIVIRPDHYRQGLGRIGMVLAAYYSYESGGRVIKGYYEEDNYKSKGMLNKVGFHENGKISYQYICKEEKQ